jgi:hypothetical protein
LINCVDTNKEKKKSTKTQISKRKLRNSSFEILEKASQKSLTPKSSLFDITLKL